MKIFTVADVPDALAQAWLQHLRDFDTAHPGCHFEVIGEAPDMSMAEILQALIVNPDFALKHVIKRSVE